MLGASMDITAHRIAEEEARALSGRLIHAQEEERRRIARELHDDLNQRLALLSVEMELFGRDELPEKSAAKFALLVTQLRELSSDLHKLAYELHPAKLEQLGLVAATGSLCGELSHQYGVAIQFIHGEIPPEIPGDTALCLFRVTQESLHNVVRHSGAKQASVVLSAGPDLLHLAISDPGSGFNFEAIPRSGGLGLVSMRERVRSIRGTIEIHSRPGEGTRVELTVPLSRKEPSL
jgi:signal transduction histidine kinase